MSLNFKSDFAPISIWMYMIKSKHRQHCYIIFFNATIDKNEVPQNEPVTMKLVIEGEGNIETLNKPTLPELDEFKIYDADTSP